MRHLATEWGPCFWCSVSKRRVHMVETLHGWQRFSETVGPIGKSQLGQVGPSNVAPDASFCVDMKVAA